MSNSTKVSSKEGRDTRSEPKSGRNVRLPRRSEKIDGGSKESVRSEDDSKTV